MNPDLLSRSAAAWDVAHETLDQVNARIHDGAPLDALDARADGLVRHAFRLFPYADRPHRRLLEIGSGTGFIMEALARHRPNAAPGRTITGLDISQSMSDMARRRIGAAKPGTFEFLVYDGVSIPLPDASVDFIFSVASLHHVPKPYVYNLFFEIRRLLAEDGVAIFSVLSFHQLSFQEHVFPWRQEVRQQIGVAPAHHWHFYYAEQELKEVLSVGTGFPHVDIRFRDPVARGDIWTCVSKAPPSHSTALRLRRWLGLR